MIGNMMVMFIGMNGLKLVVLKILIVMNFILVHSHIMKKPKLMMKEIQHYMDHLLVQDACGAYTSSPSTG